MPSASLELCLAALFAASIFLPPVFSQTPCPTVPGKSSCVCETGDGVVDLTQLSNSRLTATEDNGDRPYEYTYTPCNVFNGGGTCTSVHMCQTDKSTVPPTTYVVGDQNEQIYFDYDNTLYLQYTGDDDREALVYLHCDPSSRTSRLEFQYENFPTYAFNLYSCQACAGGPQCPGDGSSSGAAPGVIGIVLIVLFIGGVAAYFIVGAIILRVHYQASGTDLIPNKSFWVDLPFLIKDGCVFSFTPLVNYIREKRGYSTV